MVVRAAQGGIEVEAMNRGTRTGGSVGSEAHCVTLSFPAIPRRPSVGLLVFRPGLAGLLAPLPALALELVGALGYHSAQINQLGQTTEAPRTRESGMQMIFAQCHESSRDRTDSLLISPGTRLAVMEREEPIDLVWTTGIR
jgi:hypothetical protein